MKKLLFFVCISAFAQTDLPGPISAIPQGGVAQPVCSWNGNMTFRSCFRAVDSLSASTFLTVDDTKYSFDKSIYGNANLVLTNTTSQVYVATVFPYTTSSQVGIRLFGSIGQFEGGNGTGFVHVSPSELQLNSGSIDVFRSYYDPFTMQTIVTEGNPNSLQVENILDAAGIQSAGLSGIRAGCIQADTTGRLSNILNRCMGIDIGQTITANHTFSGFQTFSNIYPITSGVPNIGLVGLPFNQIVANSLFSGPSFSSNCNITTTGGVPSFTCVNGIATAQIIGNTGNAAFAGSLQVGGPVFFTSLSGAGLALVCSNSGSLQVTGCPSAGGTTNTIVTASCGLLTLSTTYTNIPGCSVTFTATGYWLVISSINLIVDYLSGGACYNEAGGGFSAVCLGLSNGNTGQTQAVPVTWQYVHNSGSGTTITFQGAKAAPVGFAAVNGGIVTATYLHP